MTINSRALSLVKNNTTANSPVQRLWSSRFADFIIYTVLRSRGFAVRKISAFLTEAIETACIALVASHASFKMGLAVTIASIVINSIIQGLFQSLRVDLFSFRRIPSGALLTMLPVLALAIYGMALSLSGVTRFWEEPLLVFLIVSRIFASIFQITLETKTAEYSLQKRVFISPWVSYGSVLFVASAGVLCVSSQTMWTVYFLVMSSSLAKVVSSVIFYHQTKLAMIHRPLKGEQSKRSTIDFAATAQRSFLLLSGVGISIIPFYSIEGRFLEIFAIVLVIKNLAIAVAERPFRAIQVEIVNAAQFKQWDFITKVLGKATKASFVISVLMSVVSLTVALLAADTFLSLCVVWSTVFMQNSALTLRLMTVGVDNEISKPVIAIRALLAVAPFLFHRFGHTNFSEDILMAMIAGEILILSTLYRHYRKVNLPQKLEFKAEIFRPTNEDFANPTVKNFLNCFRIIGPFLSASGIAQDLLLITIRNPIRSPHKARRFIAEINGALRKADLVIAIDSSHFIIWAPGSSVHTPIKTRLFKKFPLDIESITPLNRDSFLSLIKARGQTLFGGPSEEIQRHPHSFLAALELSLKSLSRDPVMGQWWVMSSSGDWQSLAGEALPRQNQLFQKIATQAMEDVFLAPGKNKSHRKDTSVNWVLSPFGKVLAIYSAPSIPLATLEGLRTIHHEMIADNVKNKSSTIAVSPAEFYMLRRILEELSKRMSFKLKEGYVRTHDHSLPGQTVAITGDGSGSEIGLFVVDLVIPETKAG